MLRSPTDELDVIASHAAARDRTATLGDVLAAVAGRLHPPGHNPGVGLVDVTHDSRGAAPGVLFACRPGAAGDGHDYAPAAVAAGAPALLCERTLALDVPQVVVESVAAVLGPAAAAVHGQPSEALALCGITGTNGKTTTAYLVESILRTAGHRTGLIGTVTTLVAGEPVPGLRTTPEATDLQRLLARMRAAGVTAAAMEVSSHGLALGRVRGTRFGVAVFTNLTQDHLDFHADLEDYYGAKALLFDASFAPVGVVNIDDPYGQRLAAEAAVPVVRVSTRGAPAEVSATTVHAGPDGARLRADVRGRSVEVAICLPGAFNVVNALCALAAADVLGVDLEAAAAGLAALPGVPGRMERVDAGQPYTVLVDYAHTPDSLASVLTTVRRLTRGQVIVVIGCGGDRDTGKRPLMGRVAADLADVAVLTSDNPRSEDPLAILAAVADGARDAAGDARVVVEVDRRAAIAQAINAAAPGDIVVVAGKGHETYQELATGRIDFDDRAVVRELIGGVT